MPVVFDHVALAAPRIADAPDLLVGILGGTSGYGGPSGEFRWWHWDYPQGGRIEVIEPDGEPGGFVHRYLAQRGPGIHHTTFKVPSLRKTCERAEALGYKIVGFNDSQSSWREAFLHPKQAMGIVVQLVEVEAGDDDGDYRSDDSAPPSPPAADPATIVGVRMRSADRERALRQWADLIGGDASEADGELLIHWPGSPMRIAVSLEAGAAGRAEAIEVRAARELDLPSGPHPLLGAVFRQIA